MALRLRIVGEQAAQLGEMATKVFGVHGGSIGRAGDNDWILPDPDRYLSSRHARVDFRAGTYFVVDTSSNGTYVNGAKVPLGKFHDYALQDGDSLRLGGYELIVSIDATNDFPPDENAIVAYDGGIPSAAVKKSTANDIGADLDLSELLEPSTRIDGQSGIHARNAYGQTVLPDDGGGIPWHMMTRPLKVARAATLERSSASASRPQGPTLFEGDVDVGLAALCRGAGIDPRGLPTDARGAAMQLAGQLLREAVLGLIDLNQGRNELRNRFGIAASNAGEAESTLSFTQGGVQEILLRLLSTLSTRAGSVEAMRDNFRELKAQNAATLTAMQAALSEVLARFDPKELEDRFERGTQRGVFGAPGKEKYWDLYAELYAGLSQHPPDGFPHLFLETFAKAFDLKVRALTPPRRGSFGGERAAAAAPDAKRLGGS
jgi:type VI secretion system FHA domain protein